MKPDYLNLLAKHNLSSIFLDQTGTIEAMEICYQLGKKEGNQEVLEWLSKMDHLSDNIEYIKDEWKNQKEL